MRVTSSVSQQPKNRNLRNHLFPSALPGKGKASPGYSHLHLLQIRGLIPVMTYSTPLPTTLCLPVFPPLPLKICSKQTATPLLIGHPHPSPAAKVNFSVCACPSPLLQPCLYLPKFPPPASLPQRGVGWHGARGNSSDGGENTRC